MTVWRVSCIFQSCASSPNNAKSREAQVPVKQECGLWWKDSSPWEDWLVTWQVWRITTNKYFFLKESLFYENLLTKEMIIKNPTCNLFLEYDPRFSVARFQIYPRTPLRATGHLHFHKRYNVVLSTRITLCTIAVDTKSFPAPVSNVSCSRTFR